MKTKGTSDYQFICLLEEINLSSDDRIDLESIV